MRDPFFGSRENDENKNVVGDALPNMGSSHGMRNEMRFWLRCFHRLVQCSGFLLRSDQRYLCLMKKESNNVCSQVRSLMSYISLCICGKSQHLEWYLLSRDDGAVSHSRHSRLLKLLSPFPRLRISVDLAWRRSWGDSLNSIHMPLVQLLVKPIRVSLARPLPCVMRKKEESGVGRDFSRSPAPDW